MTKTKNDGSRGANGSSRVVGVEVFAIIIALIAVGVLVWQLVNYTLTIPSACLIVSVFVLSLIIIIKTINGSDTVKARQTDAMLKLARQTLACLHDGMDRRAAQQACRLLLPTTDALAVAIADTVSTQGFASTYSVPFPVPHEALADAIERSFEGGEDMQIVPIYADPSQRRRQIEARFAIVTTLRVGQRVQNTLIFYYSDVSDIDETQKSIADGFAQLLSTQLSAVALEGQTKLATKMELKALQSQINPHFLFNTINTIAALIRTDPARARELLREFAVFYRRLLENSDDMIPLRKELDQVTRYFKFVVARFGADRLSLVVDMQPETEDILVPSFLIQPLVENAVQHALPPEGKLTVTVASRIINGAFVIRVGDNGTGMTEEARMNIMHPESSTGTGIAVKNVHDRLIGNYGANSHMDVESVLGAGTVVTLFFGSENLHWDRG